jgi:hypothetical protein
MNVVDIPEFEQRVRDRAYALWESEGRPLGRDAEHWRLSQEATVAELSEAAPAIKAARPKAAPRKKAAASQRAAAVMGEMLAAL